MGRGRRWRWAAGALVLASESDKLAMESEPRGKKAFRKYRMWGSLTGNEVGRWKLVLGRAAREHQLPMAAHVAETN